MVEGRLKQDRWEDKTSGQKRSKVGVVVDSFTFMPKSGGKAPEGDSADRGAVAAVRGGGGAEIAPDDGSVPF